LASSPFLFSEGEEAVLLTISNHFIFHIFLFVLYSSIMATLNFIKTVLNRELFLSPSFGEPVPFLREVWGGFLFGGS
jgi:hypothetical protein